MDVVAQWVCTSWTKRSRGGPAAARRNAAPIAFPLPNQRPPFVHEVRMHEHDDFLPQITVSEGLPDSTSDSGVILRESDGLLRVQVTVTPFGMPRRWRRPPAARLAQGQWLRWQVNYRFAGTATGGGEWAYRLETLNIAYGVAAADLFLGTPTHYIDELASLR